MPKKTPRTEAAPSTLQEAAEYFADPNVCLAYMVAMRWPDGEIACPTCGSHAVRFIPVRKGWQCGSHHARRTFSVKTGTVMEDSPIPLKKWLLAIWLLVNCKNGISSYEVARDLDVTQKTAWFLLQRCRLALQEGALVKLGDGGTPVEVDETFIGGKARNMHKRDRLAKIHKRENYGKELVMGLLDRKSGKVRTAHIAGRRKAALHAEIRKNVEPGAQLFTDELKSYEGLTDEYTHQFVNHAETYVDGVVHTNGMENFWSLLKRGLKGTYISVEPFHLFRYLDEQMFRFNERALTDQGRFMAALARLGGKRLTYKELTGAELEAHSPA
jgi:transposase-like protein